MTPSVDLVILSRNDGPLHPEVERGLRLQRGVRLIVHRVIGSARSDDQHRRDAIARARNEGKSRGASRWLMFLDDDVVMGPRCVATLVNELRRRPAYGALAADYLGECRQSEVARHVSMGATLFRRQALDQVRFVSDRHTCECQACCDDLRQLHWGINYCAEARAHHLPKSEVSEDSAASQSTSVAPLVTCLCVTQGRVPMLRRSIQCFLSQTYRSRELAVIHQSGDEATRQFLADLGERSVLPVEVPAVPRLSLGLLRNVARQSGTGKYIATWDDDDWYSPARLAEQMKAIHKTGKRGCLLTRYTLYDGVTKRAYVSGVRPWESSMVVERAILPFYPDVPKGEDTVVVNELLRQGQLAFLDRPDLYVYTHHGMNTCNRRHWEQILKRSEPVGAKASGLLAGLLGIATPEFSPASAGRYFSSRH